MNSPVTPLVRITPEERTKSRGGKAWLRPFRRSWEYVERGSLPTLALSLLIPCLSCLSVESPAPPPRRVEVLFLGHEEGVHEAARQATLLAQALALESISISYTTEVAALNPEFLSRYDVLLVYANHEVLPVPQERALLSFVAEGGGLVAIHSASACFGNSEAWVELVGARFLKHGEGEFTARFVRNDHPVLEEMEPFQTWDETYVHDRHNPDRTVLMERVDGDHIEPWTWVRSHGRGRVFYTAYGHDERSWENPGFQKLVRNAVLWTAGEEVRRLWDGFSLPTLEYEESPWIPNYEKRERPLALQKPLSPRDSMAHIQVPPGFELQLFASEPDIVNPIAMGWDERGRLWVAETVDYPHDLDPGRPGNDRIKILEDSTGDGRADRVTVFAEGLNIPTGFVFTNGGIIVAQAPDFLFLKDTSGDDRADRREVLMTGWGTFDTHAGPSNLRYGMDNWIWGAVGYSRFKGVVGDEEFDFGQGIYRFRPDGRRLEYVASFTNNTWGFGLSETFELFGSTANNEHSVYVGIPMRFYQGLRGLNYGGRRKIDGHYEIRPITPNIRQVDVWGGFTAASGFVPYTARSFPQEYWNRIAFVSEPTGHLLHRAVLEKKGAGFQEKDGWNMVAATDEWFSPVHAEVGPDGALWILDWYNFIIQHNPTPPAFETGPGNAHLNPLRDRQHGRIYRLIYRQGTLDAPLNLSPDRPDRLVETLRHRNLFWRLTAQRLLVERGETDVLPQLLALVRNRTVDEIGLSPGALHALWTLHGLGAVEEPSGEPFQVAVEALRHPSAGVRKAAVQVLAGRDAALPSILESGVVEDEDLHTRLAAVLSLAEKTRDQETGRRLYQASTEPQVVEDEWLGQAVYIAGASHREGFLTAYASDVGADVFARLVLRYADEVERLRRMEEEVDLPIAQRLLLHYLDELVEIEPPPSAVDAVEVEGAVEVVLEAEIGTLRFDREEFTVRAGQWVRLVFRNPDHMPHNVLIVSPGSLESVGRLADEMLTDPDSADLHYVPTSSDVLFATELVDPGASTVLLFRAPEEPGDYPYVCTFPGHWRIMQGVMRVLPGR